MTAVFIVVIGREIAAAVVDTYATSACSDFS